MHIRHTQFQDAMNRPRLGRLFELIRQENVCAGSAPQSQAIEHAKIESFRELACASLKR
ncbi:hypothetical protein NBRC116601_07580 [Cognatishimia sp. WU-CL00825]|uniref:hypothetical protein n=1 Tax=Cognatishimia sp. WU-CL00825 TaxID=3127658 RepID=UPI00310A43A5